MYLNPIQGRVIQDSYYHGGRDSNTISVRDVSNHQPQKLKLLGSGPTMYVILFNTPPHVRPLTRTWREKPNQGALCAQTTTVHTYCTNTNGKINASSRSRTQDLAYNLSSNTMLGTISPKSLSC